MTTYTLEEVKMKAVVNGQEFADYEQADITLASMLKFTGKSLDSSLKYILLTINSNGDIVESALNNHEARLGIIETLGGGGGGGGGGGSGVPTVPYAGFAVISDPSAVPTPPSGTVYVYCGTDNIFYFKNSLGQVANTIRDAVPDEGCYSIEMFSVVTTANTATLNFNYRDGDAKYEVWWAFGNDSIATARAGNPQYSLTANGQNVSYAIPNIPVGATNVKVLVKRTFVPDGTVKTAYFQTSISNLSINSADGSSGATGTAIATFNAVGGASRYDIIYQDISSNANQNDFSSTSSVRIVKGTTATTITANNIPRYQTSIVSTDADAIGIVSIVTDANYKTTVTTNKAHGFAVKDAVAIFGASDSNYNLQGIIIETVPSTTTFTFYSGFASATINNSGMTVAKFRNYLWQVRAISSESPLAVQSITRLNNVVTVVCGSPHGLSANAIIEIAGATDTSFNGAFLITATPSTTQFTFTSIGANGSASGSLSVLSTTNIATSPLPYKQGVYVNYFPFITNAGSTTESLSWNVWDGSANRYEVARTPDAYLEPATYGGDFLQASTRYTRIRGLEMSPRVAIKPKTTHNIIRVFSDFALKWNPVTDSTNQTWCSSSVFYVPNAHVDNANAIQFDAVQQAYSNFTSSGKNGIGYLRNTGDLLVLNPANLPTSGGYPNNTTLHRLFSRSLVDSGSSNATFNDAINTTRNQYTTGIANFFAVNNGSNRAITVGIDVPSGFNQTPVAGSVVLRWVNNGQTFSFTTDISSNGTSGDAFDGAGYGTDGIDTLYLVVTKTSTPPGSYPVRKYKFNWQTNTVTQTTMPNNGAAYTSNATGYYPNPPCSAMQLINGIPYNAPADTSTSPNPWSSTFSMRFLARKVYNDVAKHSTSTSFGYTNTGNTSTGNLIKSITNIQATTSDGVTGLKTAIGGHIEGGSVGLKYATSNILFIATGNGVF